MSDLATVVLDFDTVPGTLIARLAGQVDLSNAASIETSLSNSFAPGWRLVLDVRAVSFFDSSGIALLYRIVRQAREHDVSLEVLAPEGCPVRRVLMLSGLDGLVPIVDSVETAA
jgi:anti-sigma B factor antagonist